jgi:hypothetical protein
MLPLIGEFLGEDAAHGLAVSPSIISSSSRLRRPSGATAAMIARSAAASRR